MKSYACKRFLQGKEDSILSFSFVSSLGAVFEWAIKDLNQKLIILTEYQKIDPINYHSIQSMIDFEVKTGRVQTKDTTLLLPSGKPLPNGCRTLLRLHRALAFIASFLSEMRSAPDDASSASIAWNAYSATLGRFHAWPIRHTYDLSSENYIKINVFLSLEFMQRLN